jgi:xylan 1,4-beta-xylosidase
MKKNILCAAFLLVSVICFAQQTKYYSNPILSGFYPDPSICRVGNDYYIVNSSFAYFPGLPIFHSTDLVNWKQISNAMDRNEQLDQANAGVSRGLFAPTIRYYKGTFYIMCTLIDKGGNFIITAKDPAGPWSNPIWIPEVKGIDPSIDFIDDRTFIVYNSDPPDHKSLYDGHRTIRMREFDITQMKVIGEEKLLINGGTDISKKPIWIEGPHLYKKDNWYYLMCAEGGTGYNHSEVIFRSKSVEGPYVSYEKNPILTQRQLDPNRKDPITTTGHADLVETANGKWYAVFLGCRPYGDDLYNTGRETFMVPVEWNDGWPVIVKNNELVQYKYPVPMPSVTKSVNNIYNGNVRFVDPFNGSTLDKRYVMLRNPADDFYKLPGHGELVMKLKPATAAGKQNPSFIGFRQANVKGAATIQIKFTATAPDEKAGLMIFQNETHFYFLCKSIENNKPVVQLYKSADKINGEPELIASAPLAADKDLSLTIQSAGDRYSFYYREITPGLQKHDEVTEGPIRLLKEVDGKFLSTKIAGGFVGSIYAMYATSNGKPSANTAAFDFFVYTGADDVYKK